MSKLFSKLKPIHIREIGAPKKEAIAAFGMFNEALFKEYSNMQTDETDYPLLVWKYPEGKAPDDTVKYLVLHDYNRYKAMKRKHIWQEIPVYEFLGSYTDAKAIAGRASSAPVPPIAYQLIYLNPKGRFVKELAKSPKGYLREAAGWVNGLRRQYKWMDDGHEDEIFALVKKKAITREQLLGKITAKMNEPGRPLSRPFHFQRLAGSELSKGMYEMLLKMEDSLREKEEELEENQEDDPDFDFQEDKDEIAELKRKIEGQKKKMKKASGAQGNLFAQAQPTSKPKSMQKKTKLKVVATDAKNDVQVKTYNDGKLKGVEIHFANAPSPFAQQLLKNGNFRLAFRKGEPYRFRQFSPTALQTAKKIATVHTRTQHMGPKEIRTVNAQQKKGPVFVTEKKELSNRPIEGSFKLPELEAEKKKAAPKKKAPAKKAGPVRRQEPAKKQTVRPKVGVTRKPRQPKASKTETFSTGARQIGAGDVQKMKFPLISVPGGIGEWLGGIDRNGLAITVRGEKGSGKSHLMYQFAEAFQAMGWKGAVFTLEEGIGATTQQKVAQYKLTNAVKLIEEPYLEEIRAAARRYDFVLIDSWGKTDGSMKDFDRLRKDFPQTVFVVIFQENQAGKVRGGSSFEYDAVITIETEKDEEDKKVLDRIALITKSRYDSKHIYSIQNQTVLQ